MTTDHAQQLDELKRLHDQGILDDEAYQAARVRLAETVRLESGASNAPSPGPTVPSIAVSQRGLRVRLAKKTGPQKALIGCLLLFGLCAVCGLVGRLVQAPSDRSQERAVAPPSGRTSQAKASKPLSGTATGPAPSSTDTSGPPTKTVQELLSIVDEHWSGSEWDAIISLLENNPVTRGDAVLRDKLYAALISQGQVRADATNFTGAEFSFRSAQSLDAARGIAQAKLVEVASQRITLDMKSYTGEGSAGIAVTDVIAQGYFDTGFGIYHPNDPSTSHYMLVAVSVINQSRRELSTNPLYFTLLSDGYTMNTETEMYTMSNHFEATSLQPETYTSGWLLFLAPKAESYTLVYNGFLDDAVRKEIVVTERR